MRRIASYIVVQRAPVAAGGNVAIGGRGDLHRRKIRYFNMKVAIIGGTGFVGSYLVEALLERGHRPRLLVRLGSESRVELSAQAELLTGDLGDHDVLRRLIAEADAVIYNVGILRQFPSRGVTFKKLQLDGAMTAADLARNFGVRRFLLMSANGVETATTEYQRTKLEAEEHVQSLDLDWTVFRPSVIFGNPRGRNEFASMLKRDVIDSPLPAPLFYTGLLPTDAGAFQLSPVHVKNVAAAFAGALETKDTFAKTFTLGGPGDLTWKEILTRIAGACGRRKLMLPVPVFAPSIAAALFDSFPWFPISRDQLRMLTAGNLCRGDEIFNLLGIEAIPFDEVALAYLCEGSTRPRPSANRA